MSVSINLQPTSPVIALSSHHLSFAYGDERIVFERATRQGDKQRVLIQVRPDCRVIVKAPASASKKEVIAAAQKRGRWIHNQLTTFKEQLAHITPRKYISGESHYYLGKQYVLKVIVAPELKPTVKLLRGKFEVTTTASDSDKVKALLQSWYKIRAKEVFKRRVEALLNQALWVEGIPLLRTQSMKTQWGSCSPSGRITLNPHLVKAPRSCIDYVILHELCHIAEHNHSKQFYRLMTQVMPDWEKEKSRLDRMAASLLNV